VVYLPSLAFVCYKKRRLTLVFFLFFFFFFFFFSFPDLSSTLSDLERNVLFSQGVVVVSSFGTSLLYLGCCFFVLCLSPFFIYNSCWDLPLRAFPFPGTPEKSLLPCTIRGTRPQTRDWRKCAELGRYGCGSHLTF